MVSELDSGSVERFRRTIIVPLALWVEPLGRAPSPENVAALDEQFKEAVLRRYRELKAGGSPSVRRTDSGLGSYRYAGYLYSHTNSAADYAAIMDQLQSAMFLAQIIDESLDEIFPQGTSKRRIEVGPPTTNEKDAEKYLRYLTQQVEPDDHTVADSRQTSTWFRAAPSPTAILASIILLGAFALAHAWIQYRGDDPDLDQQVRAISAEQAEIKQMINALAASENASPVRLQPIVVRVQSPAPTVVDPTAPRVVSIGATN